MTAVRSTRALALLLLLPSAAFALGLGDIHLLSSLNAPLEAEIELVDVAPDEVNTLQAQLASRETFARYGLDWPAYLGGVQVRTVRSPDGRQLIKLKSLEAIADPFITLLVEVNWARGRLVREYTVLLDPPVYTPGQSAVANAPVSAPTTGASTHEGTISRNTESAAPAVAEAAPEPAAASPAQPPARAGRHAAAAEEAPGSMHTVQRGETLSGIASGIAGAQPNAPRTRSWILAIYQANPRAFDQNMNILHSGAVLRIPEAAQAAAVAPGEASAEIRRQYAAWRGAAGASAEAARPAARGGRLKLVTPTETPTVAGTPGAAGGAVTELQGRVQELEGQVAESKRLMELKDADLARMQSQLAAKQGAAPPPSAAPPAETAPAAPPASQAAPPSAESVPPPAAEPKPAASETPAPPAVAAKAPATPSKPLAPAASGGGSILDTVKEYWWALGVLLLALVALAVVRMVRARRASQFDDSLGRLAVAGADAAGRGFAADVPIRPMTAALSEESFLVEETGSHERPRPTKPTTPTAAARPASRDETISSDTAINLDQGDPLAEADFHMAYGLYDQAADLVRIAISREPARRDLKLKLLEVFFVWGNKEQFLQTARELAGSRAEAPPGEWEKILIMGRQLAPEDALFAAGGAVSGATAGGVDLNLEGGQSRVDFDLLGEPGASGEVPAGVDLDIGSAVGDETTVETPAGTDRNVQLLESTFLSTTGTTREMTAHMRPDGSGATAEFEGPTVEQPALATAQHPTIRQKVETALKQSGAEQTAELAIDDLGLEIGQVETVDQPGPASAAHSTPDAPTLVAGLDDHSRQVIEDAQRRAREDTSASTGAWQFDQNELEAALTQTRAGLADTASTSRLSGLGGHGGDTGDTTAGTHPALRVDLDVGATGTHAANGGLDVDVGSVTLPDTGFTATQRLSSEDLALPDLEPVTMSEVGTKLDLARAYMDMGDPDGARNILEEVLHEGSAAQKQEAQRLMESLPG